MGFNLENSAEINAVTLRKEFHGDDQEPAVTLKIVVDVEAGSLQQLVAEDDIAASLWSDEGRPRFLAVSDVRFSSKFEKHSLTLNDQNFNQVKLSKFKAELKDGARADLTFSASFEIEIDDAAFMLEYLREKVEIQVTPPPELDFEGEDNDG